MDFVFKLTELEKDTLSMQVSAALRKHTELLSREKTPRLWAVTDRIENAHKGSKTHSKLLSVMCLVLGTILFVPGFLNPQELKVPLVAGIIGIIVGLAGICRPRKKHSRQFDRSAITLLNQISVSSSDQIEVKFSDSAMKISNTEEEIPYQNIQHIIETEDIFLIIYNGKAMLLQKHDLSSGKPADFEQAIKGKILLVKAD